MKVLVVKSEGAGGYVDPQTSAYLSSLQESAAPDNGFVQNLIENGQVVKVADLGETSDWEDYMRHVRESPGDHLVALNAYRQELDPKAKPIATETVADAQKGEGTPAPKEKDKK